MQHIIDFPFWAVYVLYKIHCFAAVVAIISGIASGLAFFMRILDNIDPSAGMRDMLNYTLKLALPICFLSMLPAVAFPCSTEFKAFAAIKIANEVVNSEIGSKSQEVIVKWLDDRLKETIIDE